MEKIRKFRKKPVEIEAIQFNGWNFGEINDWMLGKPAWCSETYSSCYKDTMVIETLEGDMTANLGDYIIKGVKGEFYPCKPDIFEQTYDELI